MKKSSYTVKLTAGVIALVVFVIGMIVMTANVIRAMKNGSYRSSYEIAMAMGDEYERFLSQKYGTTGSSGTSSVPDTSGMMSDDSIVTEMSSDDTTDVDFVVTEQPVTESTDTDQSVTKPVDTDLSITEPIDTDVPPKTDPLPDDPIVTEPPVTSGPNEDTSAGVEPVEPDAPVNDQNNEDSESSPDADRQIHLSEFCKKDESGHYVYIVKRGDNLSKISGKVGWSVQQLAKYNDIENVNLIYIGQAIRIPNVGDM